MRNAAAAQWLLTRISNAEQASGIVGDLLEQNLSTLTFWTAVMRIVLRLTWRWALALPLAYMAASLTACLFRLQVKADLTALQPNHFYWGNYVVEGSACFAITAGITLALYGLRDRLALVCLTLWALWTGCLVFVWMPHTEGIIVPLLAIASLILFAIHTLRSAAWCALASSATAGALSYGAFLVFAWVRGPLVLMHGLHFPSSVIFWLATQVLPILLSGFVLTRLRSCTLPVPVE